jgi:AhpD family alkylhydroperoxidase
MQNTSHFIHKAGGYGLQEFLEIVSELSQESVKKGQLSRLQKELITLGLALYKNCHRCIEIHQKEAVKLGASQSEFSLIKKTVLFMQAAPHGDSETWGDWVESWTDFSFSRKRARQQLRELTALATAIVKQHERQIQVHMCAALEADCSIEQVFEVVPIVLLMDGAPTLSQIPRLFDCVEKYENKD